MRWQCPRLGPTGCTTLAHLPLAPSGVALRVSRACKWRIHTSTHCRLHRREAPYPIQASLPTDRGQKPSYVRSALFWRKHQGCQHPALMSSLPTLSPPSPQGPSHVTILSVPGGAVVENLPANAGDTALSPGPGRPHMPRSN